MFGCSSQPCDEPISAQQYRGLAFPAMRLRAALMASMAMTMAGCTHTVSGSAVGNPALSTVGLRVGDADQVLLGPAEVSDVTGVRFHVDADRSRPIVGSSAVPACSALDAVGMSAFVGDSWLKFHVLLFTDGDTHDHVVAEAVAVYPDAKSATAAFADGTSNAKACDGQSAVGAGGDAAWSFSVPDVNADTVRWRKQQIGIPLTWVCYGEARLRNNAVLQAMACRGDDDGRVTVTTLTDRMSASVWELSGG